jgi:hypothetical protein
MDTRHRNAMPSVDPKFLEQVIQMMIGRGLKAHFEVPQQTPDALAALTARLDEQHPEKR